MWAFDNPWWVISMLGAAVGLRLWVSAPRQLASPWQYVLDGGLALGAMIGVYFAYQSQLEPPRVKMTVCLGIAAGGFLLTQIFRAAYAQRHRGSLLEFMDSALIALLLVFCILRPFVIQAFFIPSGSMERTLLINDRILVDKFSYFFREPRHGDIVVFRAPPQTGEKKKDFIKRVVGLPGDRLSVHDGKLWRNGQPIPEPYIAEPPFYTWPEAGGEITVPPESLVVMGDNRNCSNDSHKWDVDPANPFVSRPQPFLPRENVLGRALVIFWPLPRLRLLH